VSDAQARVSVQVGVPPARAFEVFTREVDRWWRRGMQFRHAGSRRNIILIEPGVGGRLFESIEGADGRSHVIELGAVEVWEPPSRLQLRWRNATFAAGEWTTVEVLFAPAGDGTRVTVMHRDWDAIRADHPARHGLDDRAFARMLGMWWGDQLTSLRMLAARPADG
jgi:uncharacterized protein YndB with AHSA1/START domain